MQLFVWMQTVIGFIAILVCVSLALFVWAVFNSEVIDLEEESVIAASDDDENIRGYECEEGKSDSNS